MNQLPITSSYTVFIPNWRPTRLNKLLGHWAASGRKKKADASMVWVYCRRIPKAEKKRLVTLKIHLAGTWKKADPDAYWKSLLDALVKNQLLVDDSDEWVRLSPVEYIKGYEAGTEIVLQDFV